MAIDYMKSARIGAVVGVLSALVGKAYNAFAGGGQIQASLDLAPLGEGVKAQIQAGVPTELPAKIIAWLNGILPLSVEGIITLAIAGAVTFVIGAFVVNLINNAFFNKTALRRIVSMAVLGSIASGIILAFWSSGGLVLPAIGTIIALVVYYVIVALIYNGLGKLGPLKKVFIEA